MGLPLLVLISCLVFLFLSNLELRISALTYLFLNVPPGFQHTKAGALCVSSTWHIVGVGSYLWNEGPRAEVEQGMEVKREDEIKVGGGRREQVRRRDPHQPFPNWPDPVWFWWVSVTIPQVPAQIALGPSRTHTVHLSQGAGPTRCNMREMISSFPTLNELYLPW